jgi:exodeoxyribonuclease VII large subunit
LAKNTVERAKHRLTLISQRLEHASKKILSNENNYLMNKRQVVSNMAFSFVKQKQYELSTKQQQLENYVKTYINNKYTLIENLTRAKNYLDPKNVLKRGFSITQKDGKVIRNSEALEKGDLITTYLYRGKVESEVINNKSSDKNQ